MLKVKATCQHGYIRPPEVTEKVNKVTAGTTSEAFTRWLRHHDVLPSAIDRSLLPALHFATVYLLMFSLLHHSQHFAKS